jgi:hypothetical protein
MRFFADGPNIPNELLEARDNGEVVFLCGAGVSMPAGLPSFAGLARSTLDDLGVPATSQARRLLDLALDSSAEFRPPIDQLFGQLQREYGVRQVETAVARKLQTPETPDLSCHETILRLSTDVNGRARLITTNFDLLFEQAQSSIRYWHPPALPNLSLGQPLDGVIYLHGRIDPAKPDQAELHRLILGSADFGRAYLADGWATHFVKELLSRYTVVLLGYSGDDPPIRYLLEGLHANSSANARTIYAFAEGLGACPSNGMRF